MIISDEHRYLFVELPRTGSSAISRELREQYGGRYILRKHSTYREFLAVATPDQRTYFVFSGIRNPLDDAVSRYFKYVRDIRVGRGRPRTRGLLMLRDNLYRRAIREADLDFSRWFLRTYVVPYDNWASESHREFDFVIRFENLAGDFAEALRLIGLEPVRPLPVRNTTGGRAQDFRTYYDDAAIARAKHVFAPFMRRWGYEMPVEWGKVGESWWSETSFAVATVFRRLYWRYLRSRI